jgi:hypothetical protein
MPHAVRSFDEGLKSVRAARRFLEETLDAWSVSGFDFGAPLVLTELATNAVLFATPPYWVRLAFDSSELRVEVHDNSPRLPRRRDYGVEATTGRGLNLVVALCDDWGVTTNNAGKMVWATVRADDEATVDSVVHRGEEPTGPRVPAEAGMRASDRSFANRAVDQRWAA